MSGSQNSPCFTLLLLATILSLVTGCPEKKTPTKPSQEVSVDLTQSKPEFVNSLGMPFRKISNDAETCYAAMHEVTRQQWEKVLGATSWNDELPGTTAAGNIAPGDAEKFVAKLNQDFADDLPQGYHYVIPSFDHWEFVARAGSENDYTFGASPARMGLYAWTNSYTDAPPLHPVGEKLPNNWGLYDIHGNVAELCKRKDGTYAYRGGGGSSLPRQCAFQSTDAVKPTERGLRLIIVQK